MFVTLLGPFSCLKYTYKCGRAAYPINLAMVILDSVCRCSRDDIYLYACQYLPNPISEFENDQIEAYHLVAASFEKIYI